MKRNHFCNVFGVIGVVVMLWLLAGASLAVAADSADADKQIKKLQSAAKRHIVTRPKTAEQEWLEADGLIAELKESGRDVAKLEKKQADLKKKLEKRLHRAIGESAGDDGQAQPDTQSPSSEAGASDSHAEDNDKPELSSTVVSYLKKINTALDAVEANLEKFRVQSASRKMTDARKDMGPDAQSVWQEDPRRQ